MSWFSWFCWTLWATSLAKLRTRVWNIKTPLVSATGWGPAWGASSLSLWLQPPTPHFTWYLSRPDLPLIRQCLDVECAWYQEFLYPSFCLLVINHIINFWKWLIRWCASVDIKHLIAPAFSNLVFICEFYAFNIFQSSDLLWKIWKCLFLAVLFCPDKEKCIVYHNIMP